MPQIAPMDLRPLPESPLVSVVITSYNYDVFIAAALNSVLTQDYGNLEVVVADDGSTDKTAEMVRQFANRDARVRWVTGENVGQPGNANRGYAATSGEIICFLDADDEFRQGKISAVVEAFRRSPRCGLCLHPVQKVDTNGRAFGPPHRASTESGWLLEGILRTGGRRSDFPPTSAISIRRQVAERVFPIRSKSWRAADSYIHLPAAFLTEVCVIPEAYSTYRQHQRNMRLTGKSVVGRLSGYLRVFDEVFATNKEFVARELGEEYAARLKLTDSHEFLECALSYLMASGEASYKGLTMNELCALLPKGIIKLLWEGLLVFPRPVARRLFLARRYLVDRLRATR